MQIMIKPNKAMMSNMVGKKARVTRDIEYSVMGKWETLVKKGGIVTISEYNPRGFGIVVGGIRRIEIEFSAFDFDINGHGI